MAAMRFLKRGWPLAYIRNRRDEARRCRRSTLSWCGCTARRANMDVVLENNHIAEWWGKLLFSNLIELWVGRPWALISPKSGPSVLMFGN